MKKIIILFVISVYALAGCVTFSQMEDGLNNLVGKNEQYAFSILGYPDGKQKFGSETVYIWSRNKTGTVVIPQTTTTYGTIGTTPVYGTTTQNQFVPVNYNCLIKIIVNKEGTIKNWEYEGNLGGCQNYIARLNNSTKPLETGILEKTVNSINNKAPIMIDKETRLDSANSNNNSLTYNYTLINYTASELDIDKFKKAMQSNLLQEACQSHKQLIKDGFHINYSYQGKNKNEIALLTITSSNCKL